MTTTTIVLNGAGIDLQEAAERLGVHYQTAYRWVRAGLLPAVKVGATYRLDAAEVDAFGDRRLSPRPPPAERRVRDWTGPVARLHDALRRGDDWSATRQVTRLQETGVPAIALCQHLLAPVLRSAGEEWAAGDCSVAEEHRISAVCHELLCRLAVRPRGRPRGTAIVGTPAGDQHALPAHMATVTLRADGWRVHHLGPSVPARDLAAMAAKTQADVVVLSVTLPEAQAEARAAGVALAERGSGRLIVGRAGDRLESLVAQARAARSRGRAAARPV